MKCRFCNTELEHVFIDLVNAPPSNSYLEKKQLNLPETYFPLKIFVCDNCWLVQVDEYQKHDQIFDKNYAYFSSMSTSWLRHSKEYVDMITDKLMLDNTSQVIEIASNDGYLLQYFKEKQIPCFGIEPTSSTAKVARDKGLETIEEFFTTNFAIELADNEKKADLVLGNNVLAHVPDINDFVCGLKNVLKDEGTITMEFPHLLNLIKYNQFDTIYHEHFSYLSFYTVQKIFKAKGLKLYDVEKLSTHGGSLRIYATHLENDTLPVSNKVNSLLEEENEFGLQSMEIYLSFQEKANKVKYDFLEFLLAQKKQGKRVIAYGAAAKGNTLLNYCGIKNDLIEFVVDAAPSKQGKYLPGSHIPILKEEHIIHYKPDYILIFPWNIKEEIINQLNYVKKWDCEFVVAVPELEIL